MAPASLVLPLLLLSLASGSSSLGHARRLANVLRGSASRRLAQTQAEIKITFDLAKERIVQEPVDWQIVEVSNGNELREAICQSQGGEYRPNLATGAESKECFPLGNFPSRLVLYVTRPISLRGQGLPVMKHELKIEGRCISVTGQRCAIHAVSGLCSDCPLPNESGGSPNGLEVCSACRLGGDLGHETTPFNMTMGAKLWLKNIDIAGCKTDGYGGCIAFDTGDRFHWGISSRRASMTYLHARNVTFRAGYAGEDGGAIMLNHGGLAVLESCTFERNYAAAKSTLNRESGDVPRDFSHDVYAQDYSTALLGACRPANLYVYAAKPIPGLTGLMEPYQSGVIFVKSNVITESYDIADMMASPPPPPFPPTAPPPPALYGPYVIQEPAGGPVSRTLMIALIVVGVVSIGLLFTCWWCCCSSPGNEDEEEVVDSGLRGASEGPARASDARAAFRQSKSSNRMELQSGGSAGGGSSVGWSARIRSTRGMAAGSMRNLRPSLRNMQASLRNLHVASVAGESIKSSMRNMRAALGGRAWMHEDNTPESTEETEKVMVKQMRHRMSLLREENKVGPVQSAWT